MGGGGGDSPGGAGGAGGEGVGAQTNPPSENLFIGDLPAELTSQQVTEVFSAFGTVVSVKINAPKGDKGSAMVRLSSVDEAKWVYEKLNGNIPEGLSTPVIVRYANQGGKAAAKGGEGGDGTGKGASNGIQAPPQPSDRLFIGDLPMGMTDDKLTEILSAYGEASSCKMS